MCAGQCPQPLAPLAPPFPGHGVAGLALGSQEHQHLPQTKPTSIWGSVLSLWGCRRKGCCLPASSEGLSLRGAVGAVRGGGTGKRGDKGIKHLDFTAPSHPPCVPRAQALPALFTCWICWCFPEKQPPRPLKFFPLRQHCGNPAGLSLLHAVLGDHLAGTKLMGT